jgi:16S rRNA (guanine527-N7)-methyltransferase
MKIGSPQWADLIIGGAKAYGIDIDRTQAHLFATHANELIKWNKKKNLTTITAPREVALKHFLDSIAPARWIPPFSSVLDIGSGGGFPGIPLKILLPSISVTLIDGSRKKVSFLKHTLRTLQLNDIDARQARAEELVDDPDFVSAFDVITSRALSSLASFVKTAMPLLAEEGIIIALKGKMEQAEIDALRSDVLEKMHADHHDRRQYSLVLETYKLPIIQADRSILGIRISNVK